MKTIITIMGMAGILCLAPSCKKNAVTSLEPINSTVQHRQQETARLYVLLDSKPCATPQNEFTSATLDIRGIKVKNSEHGWEDLAPVSGAWDLVSLQQAQVPIAGITEYTIVHAGSITQIALTIGDNNNLGVNDVMQRCFKISTKEIILDIQGEIKAGTLNEIVISIDICGNISVQPKYQEEPCYTLTPVMAFESFKSFQEAQ